MPMVIMHALCTTRASTVQARSACPFARRHDRSSHLHVSVELRAPYSHNHMVVHMCHACLAFSLLHLPNAQESSAASHKCHFCVRRFGRVFELPYKFNAVVQCAVALDAGWCKQFWWRMGQQMRRVGLRAPVKLIIDKLGGLQ